jgi:hypothetical protein
MADRTKENIAHDLLQEAFRQFPLDVFEQAESGGANEAEELARVKEAADLLVMSRFAKYADEGRTQIELTNAGRYWMLNGGFLGFLKEDAPGRGGRGRNPEMEALRMDYMKLRLGTFWWTFGFSIASFIFALASLIYAVHFGDRLPR